MTWMLFFGLLAKSSLISIAGLIVSRWVATRPVDRVDVLRLTIGLLATLPVITFFGPELSLIVPWAGASSAPLTPAVEPLWAGSVRMVEGVTVSGTLLWPSVATFAACWWAVGALVLVGRLWIGVWTLHRWTRSGTAVDHPAWTGPLQRLDPRARPRLTAVARATGPLSWGIAPGAILIDPESLKSEASAPAILAHELAHLKRADWLFLMASRLVSALFWFNPLVWLATRELVERSEEAADAEAVSRIDRQAYARALVGLAAGSSQTCAIAMAATPHSLKKRIVCIMNAPHSARRRPLVIGLSLVALAAVATPLAALELHGPPPAPPAPPASPRALDLPAPPAPTIPPAPWTEAAPPAPPAPPVPPAQADVAAPPAPPALPQSARGRHVVWSNDNDRYTVTIDGATRDATPEERAQIDQARRQAAEARAMAGQARVEAAQARAQAADARERAVRARAMAGQARAQAAEARAQARVQMAAARGQMRAGAAQMHRGADNMREEAARLRDPAYRARQIEENRERGHRVTDAELQALGPRLERQAVELDRRADELAQRGLDAR